jgi:hypothetical protein
MTPSLCPWFGAIPPSRANGGVAVKIIDATDGIAVGARRRCPTVSWRCSWLAA